MAGVLTPWLSEAHSGSPSQSSYPWHLLPWSLNLLQGLSAPLTPIGWNFGLNSYPLPLYAHTAPYILLALNHAFIIYFIHCCIQLLHISTLLYGLFLTPRYFLVVHFFDISTTLGAVTFVPRKDLCSDGSTQQQFYYQQLYLQQFYLVTVIPTMVLPR